jgi:hypothetical protein
VSFMMKQKEIEKEMEDAEKFIEEIKKYYL